MTKKSNYSASGRWSVKDSLHLLLLCARDLDISSIAKELHSDESRVRRRLAAIRKVLLVLLKCSDSFYKIEEEKKHVLLARDTVGLLRWQAGFDLSNEQLEAALCPNYSILVDAGAGVGKTTIIAARIRALVACGLSPRRILVMAYSNENAKQIREKLELCGIQCRKVRELFISKATDIKLDQITVFVDTFHATALAYTQKPRRSVWGEEESKQFLVNYFIRLADLCNKGESDSGLIEECSKYFEEFRKNHYFKVISPKHRFVRTKYDKYWKQNMLLTLNGEIVNSVEEVEIADWLLKHDIPYVYERHLRVDDAPDDFILPDFTLFPDDKRELILEHSALDEENNHKGWPKEEIDNYKKNLEEKIKHYKKHYKKHYNNYIITPSVKNHIDILKEELEKKNYSVIEQNDSNKVKRGERNCERLYSIRFFISNVKYFDERCSLQNSGDGISEEELYKRSYNDKDKAFLSLFCDYRNKKQEEMKSKGFIDYDNMLREGIKAIEGSSKHFDCILVDEYQDLAPLRRRLLQALHNSKRADLFAVGDDWQLIYGFSGAKLEYFTNFKEHEGKDSSIFKLKNVRRFPFEIEQVSSHFIRRDTSLLNKILLTVRHIEKPAIVICFYTTISYADALRSIYSIVKEDRKRENREITGSLVVLVRNNFEREGIPKEDEMKVELMTAHKAKGEEWEDVIIVSGEFGKNGFPSMKEDDSIMKMVPLPDEERLLDGVRLSERRLFYVALTRTKNRVYILAKKDDKEEGNNALVSPFVKELCEIGGDVVKTVVLDDHCSNTI